MLTTGGNQLPRINKTGLKRSLGIVASLIIVLGAIFVAVLWRSPSPNMETAQCRRGTIQEVISEKGMTGLADTILLTMPFSGRIEAIPWIEGTEVTKDQILARIVPSDVEQMLAEARAVVARIEAAIRTQRDNRVEETAIAQAQAYVESMKSTVSAAAARCDASEARYNYAQKYAARIAGLVHSGGASQDDLDRTELLKIESELSYQQDRLIHAALVSLQAATNLLPTLIERYVQRKSLVEDELKQQLAEAKARLATIEENARRAVMRSPYDGVVLHRYVSQEQFLPAGTRLLELGRWEDLQIEADILTQDALRIKKGMAVNVFLGENMAEPVCQGKVKRIDPAAFTKLSSLGVEEQRVKVIVELDPKDIANLRRDANLGVGYRVWVRIVIKERHDTLIVPRICVVREASDQWVVWISKGQRAERRSVTVGIMNDLYAEILSGLAEGEEVVLTPEVHSTGSY
ncbi:MAG: efflux RND transporter periplasmic adaptor subunit [Thermogutta sp.]